MNTRQIILQHWTTGIVWLLLSMVQMLFLAGCLCSKPVADNHRSELQTIEHVARVAGAEALFDKAVGYLQSDESNTNAVMSNSVTVLQHANVLDPCNTSIVVMLSYTLHELQRNDELAALLERTIRLMPDNREMRLAAAHFAHESGLGETAIKHYQHLYQLNPDDREIVQTLVVLCFEQNQQAEALEVIRQDHDRHNDKRSRHYPIFLAWHMLEAKQFTNALACIDLALEFSGENSHEERSDMQYMAAECWLQLGETNTATRVLIEAYQEYPSNSVPIQKLGEIQATRSNALEKILVLKKATDLPELTRLTAAATASALNEFSLALFWLEPLFAEWCADGVTPSESFNVWMARLLHADNQFENLEKLLEASIDTYPDSHVLLNFLAYTWAEHGKRLDEALKLVDNALTDQPENAAYLDTKGWILFKKGSYYEALQYLLKAAELLNTEPVIMDHAGDAMLATGREREAIEFWKASYILEPTEEVANKLQERNIELPQPDTEQ